MPHRLFGYILLGVILGSPLLLTGGNEVLFTVLLGLTLLLSFLFLIEQPLDGALKVPLRLFLAFIGCQLLTLIPIPVSWISWLSPGLHKVLQAFPEVAYHALSWDALLTMKTLAIYVAAAGVFLVAYHLWDDPLEKVPFVVQLFFWIGTFWVAISLWLHYATPGRVPFLPWQPEPWFFGLFTNSNIFGSYCAILIPIGLAWGAYRVKTWHQAPGMAPLVALACILVGYALIISESAGGMVAVFLAIVIYWLPLKRISVPVFAAATAVAIMNLGPRINLDAYRSFADRLGFAQLALQGLASVPLTGGGLGTTSLIAGFFQPPIGSQIVDKIHNDWLELLFCTGIPGLLLLAALLILARGIFRLYGKNYLVRAGLTGALLTIGLHSLVDFPVQNITLLATAAFIAGFLARLAFSGEHSPCLRPDGAGMLALILASLGVLSLLGAGLVRVHQGKASAWQVARSMPLIRNNLAATRQMLARHGLLAPLWGELALAQENAHQFSEASGSIRKAIALQPTNPKLYHVAARLSYFQDDGDRYLEYLMEAVSLDYRNPNDFFPLPDEQIEQIVVDAARQAYRYYGPGAAGHYHQGYYLLKKIGSPKRLELIEKGAKLFPDRNTILLAAGEECLASGMLSQAKQYAEQAFVLSASPENATLLARISEADGDQQSAISWLHRALELAKAPMDVSMTVSYALECMRSQPLQEIAAFAQAGYAQSPNAMTACIIGRLYRQAGQNDQAVRWYDRSIQHEPGAAFAYQELLPLLKSMGNEIRLEVYSMQAAALFPAEEWVQPFIQQRNAKGRKDRHP